MESTACERSERIMRRKRLLYLSAFIFFLIIEVLIGAFVHSGFIRYYVGDALVVIVMYCLVRIIIPDRFTCLPLVIFAFGVLVEILQGMNIIKLLGIENRIIKIAFGSTFDIWDIVSYAAGTIILIVWELYLTKSKNNI